YQVHHIQLDAGQNSTREHNCQTNSHRGKELATRSSPSIGSSVMAVGGVLSCPSCTHPPCDRQVPQATMPKWRRGSLSTRLLESRSSGRAPPDHIRGIQHSNRSRTRKRVGENCWA